MSGLIIAGNVYIDVREDGDLTGEQGPFNATDLSITNAKTKTQERKSYMRDDYGTTLDSIVIIDGSSSVSMTFDEGSPAMLSLAMMGDATTESAQAGTAADEEVIARLGKWSKLAHRDVSDVVVKEDKESNPTTYVNGTDYTLDATAGMIKALATGAIGDGDTLIVDYDYGVLASNKISGGQYSVIRAKIRVDGTNLSDQKHVEVIIPEAVLTPSGEISFIGDKFSTFKFSGNIVKRTDETATFYYRSID